MKKRSLLVVLLLVLGALSIVSVEAATRPVAHVPTGTGVMSVAAGVQNGTAIDPGASGNLLTSNGSAWVSTSLVTNGWTTIIDCDVSAESTTNLNALGTFTMCGKTPWRNEPANNAAAFNNGGTYVASPAGTLDLTSGAGLVFAQILGAQSEWGSFSGTNPNNRGGSAVWISLANLGVPSSFTWTSQLRIWVNVSAQTIAECATHAGLAIGVDNDQYHGGGVSGQGKWVGFFGARTCSSTTNPAFQSDVIIGTGSGFSLGTSATGQTSWNTNNATTVVYTGPLGRFGGNVSMPLTMWQSQYTAGAWPAEQTLIPWAASQRPVGDVQTNDTGIGFLNADGGVNILNRFGVVLASYKLSTTVAGSITVSRIRVDYKL